MIERNFETASYRDHAEGFFLTRDIMRWFWDKYLPDEADARRANACPSRAESLQGLAPASVLTAEFDPLRDEGETYAEALQRAGVATERVRYDGQIHGFMLWPDRLPRGREAIEHSAQILRRALA